jgi:glucose-1-phosphate thymidylyltransferase
MRGIILAGGTGTPTSASSPVSSPLMPIFDKPMIYYPLATLMLAGIREVLVVSTPRDATALRRVLGDGTALGMRIEHAVQTEPLGTAHALVVGADFVAGEKVALALGDNLLHGPGVGVGLAALTDVVGAHVFAHRVRNPSDYGVVELDGSGRPLSLEEKPRRPRSDHAVPGLYFYDGTAIEAAAALRPGVTGRLEITDLNETYRARGALRVTLLGPETAWLDTGSPDTRSAASEFVRTVEVQQGYKIGCIEEIAWRRGWIDAAQLSTLAHAAGRTGYSEYLSLLAGHRRDTTVIELPTPRRSTAPTRG